MSLEPARRLRSPKLWVVISLAALLLVGITLTGVLVVVNAHLRTTALEATSAGDAALAQGMVGAVLRDDDLVPEIDAERRREIEAALRAFVTDHGLRGSTIRAADGEARFGAGEQSPAGEPAGSAFAAARAGQATFDLREADATLLEHLPYLGPEGQLLAIVSIERDASPILRAAGAASRDVLLIFGLGALVLAGILVAIFRAAQQLLNRRTRQLIESTRRDRLTGLLNHGTALAELTDILESARRSGGWVVVALVDVDGFRLLNETHGYEAGDRALRHVAGIVTAHAPGGAVVARAGPDELLVIAPPPVAPLLRPSIEAIREALAASAVRFEAADPLTLTVSVGIASYPEHAASVSELLAVAGVMLADARTGGGNRVRVDAPELGSAPGRWSAFSVLEGLVLAVDAKDRYTRLHSQQVAAYADLLAARLGIAQEERSRIGRAALLHDVGKIGVPDVILRKPGPLTEEERAVMQRHAVFGDAIVASLPGMDDVARAVRHHHERWDGTGYPDGLAGEEIPQAARILSLADVYSALTTARPYRDAMSVVDALALILDGSGTGFEPALVSEFVAIIRELGDGTLPFGDEDPERANERLLRGEAA